MGRGGGFYFITNVLDSSRFMRRLKIKEYSEFNDVLRGKKAAEFLELLKYDVIFWVMIQNVMEWTSIWMKNWKNRGGLPKTKQQSETKSVISNEFIWLPKAPLKSSHGQ